MVDPIDDTHRRTVNTQTTVQESRQTLACRLFFGQRGELRQAYREGQEDQLDALGLVLNAVVLWNTRYLDAAVTALRERGDPVDAARLSPLGHAHLNCLGRYSFAAPHRTGLRPLRDPDRAAEDGWAQGAIGLSEAGAVRTLVFGPTGVTVHWRDGRTGPPPGQLSGSPARRGRRASAWRLPHIARPAGVAALRSL